MKAELRVLRNSPHGFPEHLGIVITIVWRAKALILGSV